MTDSSPAPHDPATSLVDRVRLEMARRRALAEALRPPKRRPPAPAGAARDTLPNRRPTS